MNAGDFKKKLDELAVEVQRLPPEERHRQLQLIEQARTQQQQLGEVVKGLQESIDFLRLSIKYLLFDLEATRRENAVLRRKIEDQSSNGCGEGPCP